MSTAWACSACGGASHEPRFSKGGLHLIHCRDERLNAGLKHEIGTKDPAHTTVKLHAAAGEHMMRFI